MAVVQEGLGPPSPTHYLTPLTARTEATIQGDVLQNTFRLFLCLLKRGFSPIIGNWALLLIPFVLNTEHFNFKLYCIYCIAFQVRRQGLLCPLVFFGGNKGKGSTHLNPVTISQKTWPCDECKQMPDLFSDHITSKVTFFEARF